MSSRWKKVWADLWGNKSRAVLTMLTIAVGVLAVGFTSNMSLYTAESMDSDFLSVNPSEATVYAYPMDEDSVKIAREVPGVDAVEGRNLIGVNLLRKGEDKILVQLTAMEDPAAVTVNAVKPAPGASSIPPLGEKEILIDASAAALGYEPGDILTVELDDGKQRELRLAGYLHSPSAFPYNLTKMIFGYVKPETMVWLGGERKYNALAISVAENPTDTEHVTEVAQAVADRIERSGMGEAFVYVYQPGRHFAYSTAVAMFSVLGILGWLTVILSGTLIINTITALMSQQTRQIGIMKAVGGGNLQIFTMYATLIVIFGLGALLISVPLANKAAQIIGDGMAAYLNFFPAGYHGYTATLVQQVIIALVLPFLAALLPLYNSVRVTVREAFSDYGIGTSIRPKAKPVSRIALLIPRPMRLSLRNAFRRKARLVLTLFTLILAGAIFIGVYNLWGSFDKVIHDIQGYFLADLNVTFERGYRFDKVAPVALNIPGVSSVEGWLEYPGTLIPQDKNMAGQQIAFVAPPSTSTLIDPIITGGRWLQPGDENAIVVGNQFQAMFPDVKLGDMVRIEIDGKETAWQIVGFYALTGSSDILLIYTNYEYISQLLGEPGMTYSLRVITQGHDGLSQRAVKDQLLAAFEARGIRVGRTQLSADFVQSQTASTDIFVYFMLAMASMIAVVGGLGLMGTMGINVLERTREIGVMRAIGASNWDIQSIVIVEGMIVGLVSWLLSLALAIPITSVLCFGVGLALLGTPMPAVYGLSGVVSWLIFTLILAAIASALPARRASRLTVRDTLVYE